MNDASKPDVPGYRFGVFEVDCRTGELRKQGRVLKLRGRPFDILVLLLGQRGDVITRDELRRQLWPADTFVDFDHGLNSAMNRLREALGDSAESPRFVETLPKRGYRFIAPIEVMATRPVHTVPLVMNVPGPESDPRPIPVESPAAISVSPPSRVVLLLAASAFALAVIAALFLLRAGRSASSHSTKMTLAVLPFENLSQDADQGFFSDGFTEEMIAELGKLDPDHLGVIARTTTKLYKNAKKDIGQIRQELGVDYVLEGSIRRANNRMRITAQLIQTGDMTHLWAETYDRDVNDVLAIQSEVAMKIARSLTLALVRPRSASGQSASFPAYELSLRAKFFREQATEESARKAIEYFQRAIAIDPSYAPAHAGLADCYRLLGAPGWEVEQPADLLRRAKAGAQRALALDPQSWEARAVMSMVLLDYDWDLEGAEREVKEAIRLNPSSVQAHQYYSSVLTAMGRLDAAIAEARRALELDPLSAIAGTTLAIRYWYAGRIDEAIAGFKKTLDTNPEFAVGHWGLAQAYRARGDTDAELDELKRAVALSGNSAYMRAHLAYGLAEAGQRERALAIQKELEVEGRERYASPYHDALIATGLGDRQAMFQALERAYTDRSGWMVYLAVEPEFAGVRRLPEFERLVARVKPLSASSSAGQPER
jgi:TolB-like protein/DNA-binding winged helix-turn-helix (wHTH) protein/Tfp pilus assembly protein PilF